MWKQMSPFNTDGEHRMDMNNERHQIAMVSSLPCRPADNVACQTPAFFAGVIDGLFIRCIHTAPTQRSNLAARR